MDAAGPANDPKIWSGVVTTDSNGRFTCDYSIAGFTEAPRVQCNVVGPGQAVANARNASLSAPPTATGCAGIVTAPQSAALGIIPIQLVGAGVPVHVTATGK